MRTAQIGELVEAVKTWNPSRSPAGEFEYIDLSAVDNSSKTVVSTTTVTGAEAPSRARQLVAAGDVLVSTVRPNLNSVAVVPPELDSATASTGFTVLRPSEELDGRFLFHWVQSPAFVADMVRKATGASYPAVSDRIVKDSDIPAPPLPEQRRIAAILDRADALRAKRRQVLTHLEALTQSIFGDTFGDRDDTVHRLDDLVDPDDKLNYGVVQPGDDVPGGVPLIRVSNLAGGVVDRSDLKHIAPEVESSYVRSRIKGNEVLVSSVGSIGVVSVVSPDDVGSNVARAITRVPISDPARRAYVAAYLKTERAQRYFVSELRTVAQPTLNVGQLAATKVPLPPIELQHQFARRASDVRRQSLITVEALRHEDSLFSALQSRAFRGEL